jgi:hypothetical protein
MGMPRFAEVRGCHWSAMVECDRLAALTGLKVLCGSWSQSRGRPRAA